MLDTVYVMSFSISLVKWASTRQRMDMYSYVTVNEGNERRLLERRLCIHITRSMKWKQILPVESSNGTWIEQGSVKTTGPSSRIISIYAHFLLTWLSTHLFQLGNQRLVTLGKRVDSGKISWLVDSSVRHLLDVSHLSLESWLLSRSRLMTPSLQGVCSPWPVQYRHDSQWDNIHLWPL